MSDRRAGDVDTRGALLWVCGLAWLTVPYLLFRAVGAAAAFRAPPTRHDLDREHAYLVAAAVVALVGSAVGLAGALRARRRVAIRATAGLLALAAILAVPVLVLGDERRPSPGVTPVRDCDRHRDAWCH